MFLDIDGIHGESLDSEHGNEIEIQSWGWETNNPVRWDLNQGGHSTKVHINAVNVTKICDRSSVALYQYCVTGKHFKKAKITCRKNDGEKKIEYLIVDMTDVMISKVLWSGQGDSQTLGETIELSFAEFKLRYKLQNDMGDSNPGDQDWGFNIQTQKPA
jgi:type VI secretion system secreted protein Hcp